MKKFEFPEVEVIQFSVEDIITASSGIEGDGNTGSDGGPGSYD